MTTKKLIGKVTDAERDEIKRLFERKNGLSELFKIVDPANEALYNRVIADMGETTTKFQKWWDDKAMQYGWKSVEGRTWEIDFEYCNIYITEHSQTS